MRRDGIGRCYRSPVVGTPIARMRAKVKLRQVVTLLLAPCSSRRDTTTEGVSSTSLLRELSLPNPPHPSPPRPHPPGRGSVGRALLRFLEVTSFPRETICGYRGPSGNRDRRIGCEERLREAVVAVVVLVKGPPPRLCACTLLSVCICVRVYACLARGKIVSLSRGFPESRPR